MDDVEYQTDSEVEDPDYETTHANGALTTGLEYIFINLFTTILFVSFQILTHERRCYTRKELGMHRRQGDPDNRSHRGHPLCEFCDRRYMDNDELYRHLRRDHLYCHFCDTDGLHQYYE
ncbi:hypothetical protein J6590_102915 [Homalodisca vitripennis]|nr:hypothetical protein J6590_102915 [Homalodisca vitripennis]